MSDTSQGPGWWQASDGKWYQPETGSASPAAPGYGAGATPAASGELADWGTRAIGIIIDWAVMIAIVVVGFILAIIIGQISGALGALVGLVFYLIAAVGWLYYGFLVGAKGQSPGMAMMGLRCIGEDTGQVIGGGMGIVRTIAHIIDSLICYIGWLFPLWDPKRQTISDKLVKTLVVVEPKKPFSVDLYKP
jgi:uncharacterized RDD family membrane protein YckC